VKLIRVDLISGKRIQRGPAGKSGLKWITKRKTEGGGKCEGKSATSARKLEEKKGKKKDEGWARMERGQKVHVSIGRDHNHATAPTRRPS